MRALRTPPLRAPLREPLWLLFLVGWVFTSAVLVRIEPLEGSGLDPFPGPGSRAVPPLVDELRRGERGIDLEHATQRTLRRLPAIGRKRALDLARARWQRANGAPFEITAVRGIGPRTEELVRAWLEAEEER